MDCSWNEFGRLQRDGRNTRNSETRKSRRSANCAEMTRCPFRLAACSVLKPTAPYRTPVLRNNSERCASSRIPPCNAASPYLVDFKVGQTFGERQVKHD